MSVAIEADEESGLLSAFSTTGDVPSVSPATLISRDRSLDCLRGWAIVWMTSTHVAPQSKLTAILHLPGYVSAFEWFSILSGVVLGMRAWRAHQLTVVPRLLTAVRKRAFLLYRIHVITVLAVIVIHRVFGVFHLPSLQELGGWLRTLFLVFTLSLQPVDFMNILPLYIALFLTAPLLVRLLNRGATCTLLSISAALWLIGLLEPDLLPFPAVSFEPRSFSLLSWQFIFVLGVAAGYHRERVLADFWVAHKRKILAVAVTIALALFILAQLQRRFALVLGLHVPEELNWLLDKKTWGPLRAAYTIASIVIASSATHLLLSWTDRTKSRFGAFVGNLLSGMEVMGRRSLACFVLQLGLSLGAIAFRLDELTPIVSEVVLVFFLVLLYCCVRNDRVFALLPH